MKRILAIDWGERRVGVALSDESRIIASPHSVFKRSHQLKADLGKIQDLVVRNEVGVIVVGVPILFDGSIGPAASKVLEVVEQLSRYVDIPVTTWDERLSTAEAEKALIGGDVSRKKRKGLIDQVAASLFLQTFLDSGKWREYC